MTGSERDPERPEADGLEQDQPVADEEAAASPSDDAEAPEADAFEQAQEVPLDEDEEPR
jgi:hypothetical protein